MPVAVIDDPDDPRLELFRGLRDRDLQPLDLFIAEGKLVIRRLLASAYAVQSIVLTPTRAGDLADLLDTVTAPVYIAERDVLRRTVGYDLHRGALAAAWRGEAMDAAPLIAAARTVVVCEAVNDHENLGAIFRTALALGADAVLLDPRSSDPLYRRCVRVSMGEVLHIPFARLAPWPDALAVLRDAGFRMLALTPATGAASLDAVSRAPDERVALLLGAEGPGLTAGALDAADERVRIPIRPDVDSLNVGHAAAIALYHLGHHPG